MDHKQLEQGGRPEAAVQIPLRASGGSWLGLLLLLVVAAGLAATLLRDFLFGPNVLLFLDIGSDTYYSYYAYYSLLARYVSELRLPFWSFQLGAGTSIVSLFQFLYDPFSLVYFAAGAQHIATLIAWTFLLKTVLSAGFMFAYARYLQLSQHVAAIGGLLWAFNGFLMLWGQHFYFGSWVVFMPLLFLGIERYWRERRWGLIVLATAVLVLNLAIFVQAIVFVALYLLARGVWDLPRIGARACVGRVAGCAAFVAVGMGLSAVLWLPEYYVLSSSPRIASDPIRRLLELFHGLTAPHPSGYYLSLVSRVFSNNLQGVGSAYKGFLNYYESLQLYAGLLPLLVIPQVWAVFAARERWCVLGGIGVMLTALVSPGFAMVMNGLQYPSYRWGYGVVFLVIALTVFVLQRMLQMRRVHVPLLAGTAVLLGVTMAWVAAVHELPGLVLWLLLSLLLAQVVALALWIRAQRRWLPFAMLLATLCCAFFLEHYPTFMQRSTQQKNFDIKGESPFFDDGLRAVQSLHAQDRGLFRLEKNHWILSLNDSAVQGYFGLDSYNSLNTPAYLDLVLSFGITERLTVVQWNSLTHPYLADVLAVKYHLTRDSAKVPLDAVFHSRHGSVEIYERRSALPFGFTYDTYIPADLLAQLPAAERERALLQASIVGDQDLGSLRALERLAPPSVDDAARQARRTQALELLAMEEDKLVGRIRLDTPRLLFLPIPYDQGWSAAVNDEPVKLVRVNYGFMGIHLGPGDHTITLRYVPPLMKAGGVLSIISVLLLVGLRTRKFFYPLKRS
ncbi:MAG TPA: hypothetical protein DIC45_07715 [Comamonadaceae bacterium]|uniref:YfhO family protein n=1 Tax=Pulveribacter sp. TaxID=2678893 RepID=UPI000EB9750C|nr:YfhO family protein [Pulveribacter sp.]HCL86369.1 hypothetical protein [Comamonadaceae bacterium]